MPLGYQTVCYGNCQSTFGLKVSIGTTSAVLTASTSTFTVNVPGLLTTDQITASKPTIQAGLFVAAAVCLTNGVLSIQIGNVTVGSLTPTSNELYTLEVNRYLDTLSNAIQ
jgi:hypothetical protein